MLYEIDFFLLENQQGLKEISPFEVLGGVCWIVKNNHFNMCPLQGEIGTCQIKWLKYMVYYYQPNISTVTIDVDFQCYTLRFGK